MLRGKVELSPTMKLQRFFPACFAATMLFSLWGWSAEEKNDPGPAPSSEEQQASQELTKQGALIQPVAANLNWKYVNLRGIEKPTPGTFALLGKIPSVVELDLSGGQFKAEDLAPLAGMKFLTKLNLSRSSVNDAALAHLKALEKLEMLNLFHTEVTDAGLGQLSGLNNLKRLYVFETKVTDAGAEALFKALPSLKIDRGWDKQPAAPATPKPEAPATKPDAPKPEEKKPDAPKPDAPKPLAALTPAKPEEVGLDPAKLEELIKQKRGAGVVTLVVKDGRLAHLDAAGYASLESGRLMTTDALFWIASMTKNITATAVMILVDEGKLSLDEPASKWVPELAKVKMADGTALSRPVTLRDLLSHTSGIPDPARKATDGNMTLAQYTVDILKEPFQFQPGAKFEYSFGTTIAGRCVEVASGKPYTQFIQERILSPLKMSDTTFSPDAAQRSRVARSYKFSGEALTPAHCAFLTSEPDVKREAEPSGGLFSTAMDMARFYEMIRNGGELDGKRIVSAKGVAEMTKSHTVNGKPIQYGLGWFTNGGEKKTTGAFGAASFGHGGAFGTHGWVDPEKKMTVVYMVQDVLVPKGGELRDKFCELAAGAGK